MLLAVLVRAKIYVKRSKRFLTRNWQRQKYFGRRVSIETAETKVLLREVVVIEAQRLE